MGWTIKSVPITFGSMEPFHHTVISRLRIQRQFEQGRVPSDPS